MAIDQGCSRFGGEVARRSVIRCIMVLRCAEIAGSSRVSWRFAREPSSPKARAGRARSRRVTTRPGDPHGREWSIQHARAYHRLLGMIRSEFPEVTVEACAGGGGRIDNSVLAASDVVWTSDETGPRGRLAIQHGFLAAYPPSVMSSWVTDEADRSDERDPGVTAPVSPEFRFVVAMAGVLGIGSDLLAWDGATRDRAGELVSLYREIRPVIYGGSVTRHGKPRDQAYAVQYTGGGSDAGRVVVLAWRRPGALGVPYRVRLSDLPSDTRYRLRGRSGAVEAGELRESGLVVPFGLAADCDVVVLDRIDA